jgi:hypothetical protein
MNLRELTGIELDRAYAATDYLLSPVMSGHLTTR